MKAFIFFALVMLSSTGFAVDTNSKEFRSAVDAYRFWYPTISMEGIMNGLRQLNVKDNQVMATMQSDAVGLAFTANQDTPYGVVILDLSKGPFVIDMPKGPFLGLVDDHGQHWITDLGIPGPDKGQGGKYIILPPNYKDTLPAGFHIGKSSTLKAAFVVRIIPASKDLVAAQDQLKKIKVYPYNNGANSKNVSFVNLTGVHGDMSSLAWESNIEFWNRLAKVINEESLNERYQLQYSTLKSFGIEKGRAFRPNSVTKEFLEAVAKEGKKEMMQTSFAANNRSDRKRWDDRRWEWVVLTGNPKFATDFEMDTVARDRWFYQAIVMSPAMLKRDPTAGSLYWGSYTDAAGNFFDGSKTYKMTVPLPVPSRLFWSVTLYDNDTRSLIANGTKRASLRSLQELADIKGAKSVDLYFAPNAPAGKEGHWVKTTPGKNWFAYFRIYGPEKSAFDDSWKPGDIEEVKSDNMASTH